LSILGSSSESDSEEGQVRNISRLVLRPPGHSGKAKKGHLVFDAAFESGINILIMVHIIQII